MWAIGMDLLGIEKFTYALEAMNEEKGKEAPKQWKSNQPSVCE